MTLSQAGQGALGLVGAYFGGSVGFSIGWMIGGWLFGEEAEDQNQIFDPGAQEMPRINQALRGTTMPILFGTNRVASNIVWQNAFTTLRHESSDSKGGGGKGGGSGGGKGGAKKSSTQASYEYKWDLFYHFGMSPVRVDLFGGWLGSERLNDDTLVAITRGTASGTNFFRSDVDRPQNAALVFEEAFFSNAYPTAEQDQADNWTHFESVVGDPYRFPYTTYIGLKQLNLGDTPNIPQLSFEVGPGNAELDFDSGYIGKAYSRVFAQSEYLGQAAANVSGNLYYFAGQGSQGGGLIDVTNATRTDTRTAAEFDADVTAMGLDPLNQYVFTSNVDGANIANTEYVVMWGMDIGPVATQNWAVVLYEVDTGDGTMNAIGGWQADSNGTDAIMSQVLRIGISGSGSLDAPIVVAFINSVSASRDFKVMPWPSINQMKNVLIEDDGLDVWSARQLNLTSHVGDYFGIHQTHRDFKGFGWWVPFIVGGSTFGTRFYFYIGKADVEADNDTPGAGDANSYVNTSKATYPDGHIAYFDFGGVFFSTIMTAPGPPQIANLDFIDNNTKEGGLVPFPDAGQNLDGTTDDSDDWLPAPFCELVTEGEAAGAWLLTFSKAQSGAEDTGTTGHYTKGELYLYNPLSGIYTRYGTGEGSVFDTVDDVGIASQDNYITWDRMLMLDQKTKIVYDMGNYTSSDGAIDDYNVIGTFGTFDLGGGEDVLPPYIIHEILTNPAFGIGIPTSAIDTTSYNLALQYCDSEDIRVSTQYNREEGVWSHIKLLLGVYGGFLTNVGGIYKFGLQDLAKDVERVIDNDHLMIEQDGEAPVTVTRIARQEGANKVKVNYLDRELEYRQNFIEVNDEVDQDLNGVRPREFPPRFVMKEKTAQKIAIRTLWSNLYAKDVYAFKLGPKDADLEPGDPITLQDSFHPDPELQSGLRARIVTWEEISPLKFSVSAVKEVAYINVGTLAVNSASNQTQNTLFGPARAPANFQMYELPQEFQGANPQLFVGWNQLNAAMGARLYVSADNISFAKADEIQPYTISGIMGDALPARSAGHIEENIRVFLMPDTRSTDVQTGFDVNSPLYVQTHALDDVSGAARAVGGGNIWMGSEMLAFEGVNLIGQNDYRFDKLYRGWGGTHIQAHNSGAFWYKHAGGVFTRPYNEDKIGTTIYYKVTPFNFNGMEYDIASIDAKSHQIGGDYYKPQAQPPLHSFVESLITGTASDNLGGLEIKHVHSTGTAVTMTWPDAARVKGYGAGGFGTGLYGRFVTDTTSHNWRVEVLSSDESTVVRCLTVDSGFFVYSLATNSEDFNGWQGDFSVRVTPFNDVGDAPRNRTKHFRLFEQV